MADFDVVSITDTKKFEDRHVTRFEEVEAEVEGDQGNGNSWGPGAVQDKGKEITGWGQQSGATWGTSQETGTGGW